MDNIEPWIQQWYMPLLLGTFLLFAILEAIWPLVPAGEGLRRRWQDNFLLFVFNAVAIRLFSAAVGLSLVIEFAQQDRAFSFARLGDGWLVLLISLLVLDGVSYAIHRLAHKIPTLWAMHAIHHSDPVMDLTTGWRFHPLEALMYTLLRACLVLALGLPAFALALFELLVVLQNLIAHSNLRMNVHLQRIVSVIFITPWDHHVHHSAELQHSNYNFGTLFSFWDRLFRTRINSLDEPGALKQAGISGLSREQVTGFSQLLKLPLHYWRAKAAAIQTGSLR